MRASLLRWHGWILTRVNYVWQVKYFWMPGVKPEAYWVLFWTPASAGELIDTVFISQAPAPLP